LLEGFDIFGEAGSSEAGFSIEEGGGVGFSDMVSYLEEEAEHFSVGDSFFLAGFEDLVEEGDFEGSEAVVDVFNHTGTSRVCDFPSREESVV